MAEVRVGKNESLETALKRFKRSCAKDGVIAEVRKREHYEKPSVKVRRSPKQLVSASIDKQYIKPIKRIILQVFLKDIFLFDTV